MNKHGVKEKGDRILISQNGKIGRPQGCQGIQHHVETGEKEVNLQFHGWLLSGFVADLMGTQPSN
jgi:hypothetical protein